MNLNLNNKTALVTASTAGIGYAIAELLLKEGASVVVNGRTQERVDRAVERLKTIPGGEQRVRGFAGDLTQSSVRRDLFGTVPEVDILINNLGIYESKPLAEIEDEDWQRMFDTNVVSGASLSRYYLPKMIAKNWGRIIFIASETAVNIPVDMIHYGLSKSAQVALSRGLAETTKGTNVTVNSVLPGPTLSEGVGKYLQEVLKDASPEKKEDKSQLEREFILSLRPTSLLQRFATGEEVANLVTYLASPLSSATNGAALRVEGGLLRNA